VAEEARQNRHAAHRGGDGGEHARCWRWRSRRSRCTTCEPETNDRWVPPHHLSYFLYGDQLAPNLGRGGGGGGTRPGRVPKPTRHGSSSTPTRTSLGRTTTTPSAAGMVSEVPGTPPALLHQGEGGRPGSPGRWDPLMIGAEPVAPRSSLPLFGDHKSRTPGGCSSPTGRGVGRSIAEGLRPLPAAAPDGNRGEVKGCSGSPIPRRPTSFDEVAVRGRDRPFILRPRWEAKGEHYTRGRATGTRGKR